MLPAQNSGGRHNSAYDQPGRNATARSFAIKFE
jgi:hypothetical protein